MSKDNPRDFLMEELFQMVFRNHALAHNIGGDNETVQKYKRKEIYDYYKKFYCANNLVISICSDLDFDTIQGMIQNPTFQGYKPKLCVTLTKMCPHNPTIVYDVMKKMLEQVHLVMGFPICGITHPDNFALTILSTILGGGLSSRLYTDLRIKNGLSYNITVSSIFYVKNGCFCVLYKF